jgi:hypothetical protein
LWRAQHAAGGLGVGHDGGKRLIELMRERGGHLTNR